MLELLVVPALTSAASQLVKALVGGRDVGRDDAASVATAVLEAVLSTQQRTNDDLARLEGKVDKLLLAPYLAGMSAGTRFMGDAAAAHRSKGHRAQMLAEARTQFLTALGHAPDAVRRAQCETYYGLAWLADGSVEDAVLAQGRAARLLEEELLVTLPLAVDEATKLRQRQADGFTVSTIKGFFTSGDAFSNPDVAGARFREALREHRPLQQLRVATGWGRAGFPLTIHEPRVTPHHPYSTLIFMCESARPAATPCGALGVVVDPVVTVLGSALWAMVGVTNHRDEPLLYTVDKAGAGDIFTPGQSAIWQAPLLKRLPGYPATALTVPPGRTDGGLHTFSATNLNEVMVNVRLGQDGPYVRFAVPPRT